MAKSRIIGAKAHAARLKKISGEAMTREVGKALMAAGERIETDAATSMTAGRKEVVDKRKHVPSKPGEPPAVLWGDLRRSLQTESKAPLVIEVSAQDRKAAWLEFGTSRMAARPFMRPAVEQNRKFASQIVTEAVDRVVKKSKSGDS